MKFNLTPEEVLKKNLYLILFLLCANIVGVISKTYFNFGNVYGLVGLFNFDSEKNIPTLYSSIALLFAAVLLSIIAFAYKQQKTSYIYWLTLSLIFLFLSIDEISSIHERFSSHVNEAFGTSVNLFFAWVIPYGIASILFVIVYSRFLFSLPTNIMILFLISGATFVSGALGFELLAGEHVEIYGKHNILYSFYYTCEESLEMFGIAIFIYALLTHITNQFESMTVTVNKNDAHN